jgi:hypothetical protein
MAAISAEALGDLAGQFARRRQHQHAAGFAFGPQALCCEVVENRQRKGRGLAGAGLRNPDDVAALHRERDGLTLDRGRGEVVLLRQGAEDRLYEAEVVK